MEPKVTGCGRQKMTTGQRRLAILVGGGPAPGINSTISAAAIEATNSGLEVVGIYDGFQHLMEGRTDQVRPLPISDVSWIHFQGGSILRTSRANPTRDPESLRRVVGTLLQLGVTHLLTIGGDGTAFCAFQVAKAAEGAFRVAHAPKTIDNDLPLPGGMPTFGFETARHVGTQMVLNLMEDSRSTNRWYFVVVMGRKAGHLALGIGKSAGATLTLIPEEFTEDRITLDRACAVLEGAILKRQSAGRSRGVAVIAEGISEKLDPEELARIPGVGVEYDHLGRLKLSQIRLGTALRGGVERSFAQRGQEGISIVDVSLGYELRCAQPIPFDIDYTRTLGHGAVRFLLSGREDGALRYGGLVCLQDGNIKVIPPEELRDPATGHTRVRYVDILSEHYTVARKYMIRLEREDLEDPQKLARLAETAGISLEEFRDRFTPACPPVNGLGR
jgi:6-phosphofructokinase 1